MGKKVVILDYGLGNIYSIKQACLHFGIDPIISSNPKEILGAGHLILPGVGAFEVAMNQLKDKNLVSVLNEYIKLERPLMGVCLGMQLLFEKSYEFGEHEGLGFIEGDIIRFPKYFQENKIRIPHIGWNQILESKTNWHHTPLKDSGKDSLMYFVHSYFARPKNEDEVLSTTIYNNFEFVSSVRKNNIFGFQFHPEKSGKEGQMIYKNFLSI